MSAFNEILFKTAVLSMSIDGELHSDEVSFFKSFSEDSVYFEAFSVEEKFKAVLDAIRSDVEGFIDDLAEEVRGSELNKQYTLIILDVVMALIHSDDRIDQNEIYLLSKLLEIFDLDREFLATRYPDIAGAISSEVEINVKLVESFSEGTSALNA